MRIELFRGEQGDLPFFVTKDFYVNGMGIECALSFEDDISRLKAEVIGNEHIPCYNEVCANIPSSECLEEEICKLKVGSVKQALYPIKICTNGNDSCFRSASLKIKAADTEKDFSLVGLSLKSYLMTVYSKMELSFDENYGLLVFGESPSFSSESRLWTPLKSSHALLFETQRVIISRKLVFESCLIEISTSYYFGFLPVNLFYALRTVLIEKSSSLNIAATVRPESLLCFKGNLSELKSIPPLVFELDSGKGIQLPATSLFSSVEIHFDELEEDGLQTKENFICSNFYLWNKEHILLGNKMLGAFEDKILVDAKLSRISLTNRELSLENFVEDNFFSTKPKEDIGQMDMLNVFLICCLLSFFTLLCCHYCCKYGKAESRKVIRTDNERILSEGNNSNPDVNSIFDIEDEGDHSSDSDSDVETLRL